MVTDRLTVVLLPHELAANLNEPFAPQRMLPQSDNPGIAAASAIMLIAF